MDYRIPKIFSFNFPFNFFIGDNNFKYSNYQNNLPRILYLDGYFQHCLEQETFNAIKLLLLQIKKNNPHNLYCHIKSQAVIHIRGGDFLKLNWNTVASKKYYLDAMKFMQKNHRVEKFIVVTDDRAYSDTILNKSEFFIEYSNGNLEEDFYLIGSHDKRILSNSTFSLWASELGRNSEETLVIAPKLWTPNKKRIIKLTKEININ
jgi:hypothetical protein